MNPDEMLIGAKLRKLRQRRGLTQKELAKAAGVGESALRSYELGDRRPKPRQLQKIALALKVRPEALGSIVAMSDMEIIYTLFEFEEQGYLEPSVTDNTPTLASRNSAIRRTLREWTKKRAALDSGEIDQDEYDEWKSAFNPHPMMDDSGNSCADPYTGIMADFRDNERVGRTLCQSPFRDDLLDELNDALGNN